jgi:nucleoside-diphosphate kinase
LVGAKRLKTAGFSKQYRDFGCHPDCLGASAPVHFAVFVSPFWGGYPSKAPEVVMPIERTLSIVKPDGVGRNLIGEVYRRFEQAGLRVIAARMMRLSQGEAEGFYAVHRERPFFKDLVKFMTSGPVMVQVLEGEGAIAKNREVMGATDPKKADKGTIRADLATSIDENIVHGSDAPDTAAREISYFFREIEVCPRTR